MDKTISQEVVFLLAKQTHIFVPWNQL